MKKVFLLFLLSSCVLGTPGFAQQAIFLKLDGISGSSQATGQAGAIELTGASFSESTPTSTTGSTGSSRGKVELSAISITQAVDYNASPLLMTKLVTGSIIRSGSIEFYNTGSGTDFLAYKVELTGVKILNHSVALLPNCPSGCSAISETFQIDFETIKVTTYPVTNTGQPVVYSWNRKANDVK